MGNEKDKRFLLRPTLESLRKIETIGPDNIQRPSILEERVSIIINDS